MKPILILLLCINLHAAGAQPAAIALEKMNVLYRGADNPIKVVVSDLPAEALRLQPSQGEILRADSAGHFVWRLCAPDTSLAWLVLFDSLRQVPLDTFLFRVKTIPEPSFEIKRGHHGGWIAPVLKNFDFDLRCNILQFTAEFIHKNSDPVLFSNAGARFNSDVQNHANSIKPGDRVYFFDFVFQCGCDPRRRKSGQQVEIKVR